MKIYVVDDERIIRVSLADELRDAGNVVFEFAHANTALTQMANELPDLVITGLKMPDVDGIEFLNKIKNINKNIYVVFMTAYSNLSTAVEALKLGAYDYVEKPVENDKVLIIVIIRHILELESLDNRIFRRHLNKLSPDLNS